MKQIFSIALLFILSIAGVQAQEDTIQFSDPQKLNKSVNSSAEESFPLMGSDGQRMYFARTFHPGNLGGKMAGQDIWYSEKSETGFAEAKNLTGLNNKGNNVVIGLARNGKRLYLLNQFTDGQNAKPGISVSDYDSTSAKWSSPTPVAIPELNVEGNFYSALVSENEDFILWSIPELNDSTGNDLFVSRSNDGGLSWSAPISLGGIINSNSDEISPFYDLKRELLFFSRNEEGQSDNYDIYYSRKLDETWKNWSEPVKAGNSLNSSGFDAYFYITKSGVAYLSSNRNDSLSNIYVSELSIVKPLPIDTVVLVDAEPIDVEQEEREMPDPVLIIETTKEGKQTDRMLESLTKEELLDENTSIRFVYFDYDKYNISAKYIEVLDDAAILLDRYPDLNLRIDGHTDAIGSDSYNNVLSENRAESAKEFLVINGVDPDRIATKALGKKQPYATNLTAEGRALNRRVELFFKERK